MAIGVSLALVWGCKGLPSPGARTRLSESAVTKLIAVIEEGVYSDKEIPEEMELDGNAVRIAVEGVKQRVDNRILRKKVLRDHKLDGSIGENRRGKVEYFKTERTRTEASYRNRTRIVILRENEDRIEIIERIIKENSLARGSRQEFQRALAEYHRRHAAPGEKVESIQGEWTVVAEK